MGCPKVPPFQILCRLFGTVWLVGVLEGEPHLVGPRGLEVMGRQSIEYRLLALRQVGWVAQPEIAGAFQQALVLLFAAADLIDRIVDDLDGWNLSKVTAALGRFSATALIKAGL